MELNYHNDTMVVLLNINKNILLPWKVGGCLCRYISMKFFPNIAKLYKIDLHLLHAQKEAIAETMTSHLFVYRCVFLSFIPNNSFVSGIALANLSDKYSLADIFFTLAL